MKRNLAEIHQVYTSTQAFDPFETIMTQILGKWTGFRLKYREELLAGFEKVLSTEDEDYLYFLVAVAFYDGFDRGFSKLLSQLLNQSWHRAHEDIAEMFEDLKDPITIPSLFDAAKRDLDYDEGRNLSGKCIWALAKIQTVESRRRLVLLSENENELVRKFALDALDHFRIDDAI